VQSLCLHAVAPPIEFMTPAFVLCKKPFTLNETTIIWYYEKRRSYGIDALCGQFFFC